MPRRWLAPAPFIESRTYGHSALPKVQPEAASAALALDGIASLDALDQALLTLVHPLKPTAGEPQRLFEGPVAAPLLVLGEMPQNDGSDEARLLMAMLAAIGMAEAPHSRVNILPWPMHGQRPARPADLALFSPYAMRALVLMKPRLILALGSRAALHADPDAAPSTLRGRWLELAGAPMVASFAPGMLLRQPRLKAEAWADLQRLQERLEA